MDAPQRAVPVPEVQVLPDVKAIGTAARKEIERELAEHVHLDLSVRVRRSWRADDALLDRLGIT